jgi:signal transduction histidine kinase/CheY-like chemotaxis protein
MPRGVVVMRLNERWTEIQAVPVHTDMPTVFDILRHNKTWPFLPVVDGDGRPVGVVREHDLKDYAYSRYGRELISRQRLDRFLSETLVLPQTVARDELLAAVGSNPNPDGIVMTAGGVYRACLLTSELLNIFEDQRVDAQVRLAQAQKMEAIGTLAGGIAHDLNNILTPILGYAELMRDFLARGRPVDEEMVQQVLVSSIRARDTVGRILAFSRHQKAEQQAVSLGEMVREVIRLISPSLPSTIDVEVCLEAAADEVFINPVELQQVVMNLCNNAYQAMRERAGHLQVSLVEHHGPLLGWSMHQGPLPESLLRLTVRDTGTGIGQADLPRIFDPFFTTKKQNEGTGLGLAIVHGVVARAKGCVSVETELGRGSAFHVYLPRCRPVAPCDAHVRGADETAAAAGRPEVRVLFVDDEYPVTRLAQRFLSQYGIAVETQNDSGAALACLQERIGEFDVLVTDQTMPSITGLELARHALALNPELPILLCTGYGELVSPEAARSAGCRGYMNKPPDFRQMAAVIHEWTTGR